MPGVSAIPAVLSKYRNVNYEVLKISAMNLFINPYYLTVMLPVMLRVFMKY